MNIQKEMDAINEPTPGWAKIPGSKGYIQFHSGPCRWEKRWKALRKELRKLDEDTLITTAYFIKTLMTEITRKIK